VRRGLRRAMDRHFLGRDDRPPAFGLDPPRIAASAEGSR
jgi:hypothetical protein